MLLHVPIKGCLLSTSKSTDLTSKENPKEMNDQAELYQGPSEN